MIRCLGPHRNFCTMIFGLVSMSSTGKVLDRSWLLSLLGATDVVGQTRDRSKQVNHPLQDLDAQFRSNSGSVHFKCQINRFASRKSHFGLWIAPIIFTFPIGKYWQVRIELKVISNSMFLMHQASWCCLRSRFSGVEFCLHFPKGSFTSFSLCSRLTTTDL